MPFAPGHKPPPRVGPVQRVYPAFSTADIVHTIYKEYGLPRDVCQSIVTRIIRCIIDEVLSGKAVTLQHLGRFVIQKGKTRISFRPTPAIKAEAKEFAMEKLGVVTDKTKLDKTAAEGDVCPECGQKLDSESPVPRCPTHGTKPFETPTEKP